MVGAAQVGDEVESISGSDEGVVREAVIEQKLVAAKRKVKENSGKDRLRAPENERSRRVPMDKWVVVEEEEFVPSGETGGEFSQQQDFVPL